MSLMRRMRRHRAVYWAPGTPDEEGQPTYEAPVQVRCRWDDNTLEYKDREGRTVVSRAVVYPDRPVLEGGVLWRGKLADVVSQENPFDNPGAYEIKGTGAIDNVRATETLYMAML